MVTVDAAASIATHNWTMALMSASGIGAAKLRHTYVMNDAFATLIGITVIVFMSMERTTKLVVVLTLYQCPLATGR